MNSKQSQLTACLFIISFTVLQTGCGYGKVSPLATQYAQAIYTTANLQKSEKIEPLRQKIEQDVEEESLTSRDANYLLSILDKADAGQWMQAMQASRQLMENQIQH